MTYQPNVEENPRNHHVCPWWVGYLIASPLRKLGENPETLLEPLVRPGMTAVDIGCAMGFFSLPLARMVGDKGRVVCVDVQDRMLSNLVKRARRRDLHHVIETRLSTQENPGLDDLESRVDLALAVHVVHETAYPRRFLSRIRDILRPGGRLMLIEPSGHVSDTEFEATRHLCAEVGLEELEKSRLRRSTKLVLQRPEAR